MLNVCINIDDGSLFGILISSAEPVEWYVLIKQFETFGLVIIAYIFVLVQLKSTLFTNCGSASCNISMA